MPERSPSVLAYFPGFPYARLGKQDRRRKGEWREVARHIRDACSRNIQTERHAGSIATGMSRFQISPIGLNPDPSNVLEGQGIQHGDTAIS